MKIVKKILGVAVKIIAGIFAFYLFLSLVLIPLLTPWILGSQARKILKHPVQVRRVFFNPFLLRLSINGLKILDADKQVMLGFDRCWGDVSFISLLKKAYRVESLGLRGLVVNVVLSDKGEINLLGLVPAELLNPAQADKQPVTAAAQQPADTDTASATGAGAQPLPLVTVDLISISSSTIRFTDRSVDPNFTTALSGMELRVKGL
ncbi:MAG: hypothetical protein PHR11_07560, partial [Candidatus Omnitrophica bacterium]|nr:hypothetical protein [Candidatus Omnitrophota bacterium]